MEKTFLSILFFSAVVSNTATAQTAQEPLPATWDLQACIDYASAHNISVNSLRLSQQSTEQDLVLAKAAKYPSLSATATQSLSNTTNGIHPASGYGLSSDMVIYNGGYLNADVEQKQLQMRSAGLDVLEQQNNITLQITQAYYDIAMAKENVVYVKDLVVTSEAQVKQGEQLYKAGSIAKKDLLQLQALLANDRYNLVTAQNAERQYTLTLKQLLQLPSDIVFETTVPDTSAVLSSAAPLAVVQQRALQSRPEIASSELGVQIAQLDLNKARAGSKPTISVGAIMNTNYANTGGASYAKTLGNNFYQQAGVTLSIPIFNRKVTQTNVAKAKINIAQANLNASDARVTLLQEVEQAYINWENAQGQYNAAEEQLGFTREAFRIASAQLNVGAYNLVEFLQQRNLYVQALQAHIQAKYAVTMYSKVYDFYNGIPVTQ